LEKKNLFFSPLTGPTKKKEIARAEDNNELPTAAEIAEAKGEIKDVRKTTAAAAAAAAAEAAGSDGKLAAYTLQLIDATFRSHAH
jgi:hypothetical protein